MAYAVDVSNGKLLWQTKVDDHAVTRATGAPLFYKDRLYVRSHPTKSWEAAN